MYVKILVDLLLFHDFDYPVGYIIRGWGGVFRRGREVSFSKAGEVQGAKFRTRALGVRKYRKVSCPAELEYLYICLFEAIY